MSFKDYEVASTEALDKDKTFFSDKANETLETYLPKICDEQYLSDSGSIYSFDSNSQTYALPELNENEIEFLISGSSNTQGKPLSRLHDIGNRVFTRKGKEASAANERFRKFFGTASYVAHEQSGTYLDGGSHKYIPTSDKEIIKVKVLDDGKVQFHWTRVGCRLDWVA